MNQFFLIISTHCDRVETVAWELQTSFTCVMFIILLQKTVVF